MLHGLPPLYRDARASIALGRSESLKAAAATLASSGPGGEIHRILFNMNKSEARNSAPHKRKNKECDNVYAEEKRRNVNMLCS